MSQPFDPNAAPPPQFPPPESTGAYGAPQPGAPAYGAPPPASPPIGGEVPAFGAPPPVGMTHSEHTADPALPTGVLAGFAARLGATVVDGLIVSLISLVALVPLGLLVSSRWETTPEPCTVNGEASICDLPTDDTIALLAIAIVAWFLFALLVAVFYHVRPISKTGQTIGRRLLGIKVVSAHTGEPPSLGMALLRYVFASFVSSSLCSLGYLWMLWDAQNQTWHDKVASTVVVRA